MEEQKNVYEIKVVVKEAKTKEGKTFNTYRVVEKTGKLVDLRFRKDVKNVPTETCIMVVDKKDIHLDSKREYPCYWVKAIQELKPIELNTKELPFD